MTDRDDLAPLDELPLELSVSRLNAARRHLERMPEDRTACLLFARNAYHAAVAQGHQGRYEEMDACVDEIRNIVTAHPDDYALRVWLARAAFEAQFHHGFEDRSGHQDVALNEMREAVLKFPRGSEIRLAFARSARYAAAVCANAGRIEDMETHLRDIARAARDFPRDAEINETLATAASTATECCAARQMSDVASRHLETCRNVARDFDTEERIVFAYASALRHAANGCAGDRRLVDAEDHLQSLRRLALDHPNHPDIHRVLADAAAAAVSIYAAQGTHDPMNYWLSTLRKITASFRDDEYVQTFLPAALADAVAGCAGAQEWAQAEARLAEFATLVEEHTPAPNAARLLVHSAATAARHYQAAGLTDEARRCCRLVRQHIDAVGDDPETRHLAEETCGC